MMSIHECMTVVGNVRRQDKTGFSKNQKLKNQKIKNLKNSKIQKFKNSKNIKNFLYKKTLKKRPI